MRYLPWNGRIGRLRFIFYILLILANWLVMFFYSHTMLIFFFSSVMTQQKISDLVGYISLSDFFISLFLLICLIIRRYHDQDKSGLRLLWLLVPISQIHTIFGLCIEKGTPGPNRFGSPPPRWSQNFELQDVVHNDFD